MIAPGLRRRVVLACLVASMSAPFIGLARSHAADASGWVGNSRSALRLIAGTPANGQGLLRAGIEIRLAPGWKTYWRYPGDSGIAAAIRFCPIDERQVGRGRMAGAARLARRRGDLDRVQGQCPPAPSRGPAEPDAAGRARARFRLRDLRARLRSASPAARNCSSRPPRRSMTPRSRRRRRACRSEAWSALAPAWRSAPSSATAHGRTRASSSTWRRLRAKASICSPKDRPQIGPCRCPSRPERSARRHTPIYLRYRRRAAGSRSEGCDAETHRGRRRGCGRSRLTVSTSSPGAR